jgi:hypothetical protein
MTRSDLVDLTLRKHAETKLAILVSDDGEAKNVVWLPLSQIEVVPADSGHGGASGVVLVTMPSWLATDKGLV